MEEKESSEVETVVDDLDACIKFPWGRYAFEHNLKDVSSFLEKCDTVVPTSWVFTSFPIPLEVLLSSIVLNCLIVKFMGMSFCCVRSCWRLRQFQA